MLLSPDSVLGPLTCVRWLISASDNHCMYKSPLQLPDLGAAISISDAGSESMDKFDRAEETLPSTHDGCDCRCTHDARTPRKDIKDQPRRLEVIDSMVILLPMIWIG